MIGDETNEPVKLIGFTLSGVLGTLLPNIGDCLNTPGRLTGNGADGMLYIIPRMI